MNDADQARFEMLRSGGQVSRDYIREYYGFDWLRQGEIREDFDSWYAQSPRRTKWNEDQPSRYLIEAFLRNQRVEPAKWSACRLGMDSDSFRRVLAEIHRIGLRSRRYEVYPALISLSFGDDLDSHLPSMKFRTFGDHNSYCEFLHQDLRTRLGVTIKELWCATSISAELADSKLLSYPRAYAAKFDCITLDPERSPPDPLGFRQPAVPRGGCQLETPVRPEQNNASAVSCRHDRAS